LRAYLPGVAIYIVVVSSLKVWWGSSGWGPRYLLPVLPFLFLPVGLTLAEYWARHKRLITMLVGLSIILNLMPALVNSGLQCFLQREGNRHNSLLPRQHMAVWSGAWEGVSGISPQAPPGFYFDGLHGPDVEAIGTPFPDTWWADLMRNPSTNAYGIAGLAGLLAIMALGVRLGNWRRTKIGVMTA
jgi:hypothetical protein